MSARPLTRPVLVADLFCGAGGSSTGARRALRELGLSMDLVAVNHWAVAVETHSKNHPGARHLCIDVYKTTPREAIPGGRLDLLMASPTCTFFSRSRGGKPISWDQRWGRMTPTQVLRWLTDLDVSALLVENVPEFMQWGPIHPGPRLEADGKTVRVPAPPIRNERCIAARCTGGKPCRLKRCERARPCRKGPCTRAKPCGTGIYFRRWLKRITALGYQLEHRVLNAADHGDATTRQRFFLIARKDGKRITWPEPTHSKCGGEDLAGGGAKRWRAAREIIDWSLPGLSVFNRKKPLSPKTMERIYAGAVKFGWPEPYLVILRQHMGARGIDQPLPTLTAGGTHVGLVQPTTRQRAAEQLGLFGAQRGAQPLLVRSGMHQSNALCVRDAGQPIPTVTTDGGIALVEPFVLNRHGDNGACRAHDVDAPLPTATCRGAGYVAQPVVFQVNQGEGRTRNMRGVDDSPLQTVVTRPSLGGGVALVLPQGGGGAARPVDQPVATIATDGAHALIAPYYGQSGCAPVDDPLATITTRDRFGIVAPVTHHDGSQRARSLEDPLPTITAARRGELAFISAAFGEREGQAARVRSVDAPVPTICATGYVPLVEGQAEPRIDILFRMLQPHELAAAMGFSDEETSYEFSGTKEEVTRQIGNAVPVRTAAALVGAIFAGRRARVRRPAVVA